MRKSLKYDPRAEGGTLPVPRAPVGHQGPGWQVLIGATFSPPILTVLTNDPIPYSTARENGMDTRTRTGSVGLLGGPSSGFRAASGRAICRMPAPQYVLVRAGAVVGTDMPYHSCALGSALGKVSAIYQARMPELYVCRGRPKYRRWWYDDRH